jgi:hypothetical protein
MTCSRERVGRHFLSWPGLCGVARSETFAPIQRFDIAFDDGLAGLVAIDESTYASTRGYGLPDPDDFDASGFAPLPWPAWKEEGSPRAALYGDLGSIVYRTVDSYFLYGGNAVLLIDVADCVPRIARL